MTTTPAKRHPLTYHAKTLSIHDMGNLTPHKTATPSSCTSQSTALFSANSKSSATPTGFSSEFRSYIKTPSNEHGKIALSPNILDATPKGINQFNSKEMDEFGTSPVSAHLTKRHLSDHSSVLEAHKKSMGDIAARIKRKSVSLTSTQVIEICGTQATEGFEGGFERNKNLSRTINNEELNRIRDRIQKEQFNRRRASAHILPKERSKPQQVSRMLKIKGKENLEGERLRRDLGNITVLENVLKFVNFEDTCKLSKLCYNFRNIKTYKKIFQSNLDKFFAQGLEQYDQFFFWNSTVNIRKLRHEHPFTFTQHFAKRPMYMEEIKKDLDRTLPEYDKFSTEEGKASLLRVLVATSNTVKDMGYIQGLNSIAGTFLLYLKDEETFWILMYFMEKLRFKDLLNDTFDTINELNYQLKAYLHYYLPDILKYFEQEKDFETSLFTFTTQWFLTLFSHQLSVQNVLKVWNFLFTKGRTFLIQLCLAIFQKYQNVILQMDAYEVGPFLKNELNELPIDEKELFESALSFKVSKKLTKEFELYYRNGKPEITLRVNALRKLQIRVDPAFRKTSLELNEQRDHNPQGMDLRKTNSTKERINSFFNSFTGEISDSLKSIFSRKPSDDKVMNTTVPTNLDKPNASNIDDEDAKASHQIALTQGDALPVTNFLVAVPKFTASRGVSKTLADEKSFESDKRAGSFNEERTDLFSPGINYIESKVERFERRSKKAATSIFSFQKYTTNGGVSSGAASSGNGSNPQLSSRADNNDQDTSLVREGAVERRSSVFGLKVLSSIFDGKKRGSKQL